MLIAVRVANLLCAGKIDRGYRPVVGECTNLALGLISVRYSVLGSASYWERLRNPRVPPSGEVNPFP